MEEGDKVSASRTVINQSQIARSGQKHNAISEVVDVEARPNVEEKQRVNVADNSRADKRNQKSDGNRVEDVQVHVAVLGMNLLGDRVPPRDFRKNTE